VKAGDVVHGYRVVTDPTNAGGGKCVWAFAEKDGAQFFLKRFLEPKRPREGSGSAESRRIRLETCRRFEERHRAVMDRLPPDAPGAGNLVLATDFFHEGSTYYKVTERIDTAGLAEPHTLDAPAKAVLLRTLGASLRLLHAIGVVHGDLKPANVLVQRRGEAAFHTAKLIDFDDAYVAGDPPDRAEIAGDSLYGAPEWRRYVQGDETVQGSRLTTAADVFALGLMTHLWLTGELPGYDRDRFGSPADAVDAGAPLRLDPRLSDPAHALLRAMTAAAPERRPDAAGFLAAFRDPRSCALGEPRERPEPVEPAGPAGPADEDDAKPRAGGDARPGEDAGPDAAAPRASRLRVNLPGSRAASPPADRPTASRVRINLGGRASPRHDAAAPGSGPGPRSRSEELPEHEREETTP
jgi:serine/threonine protein kinase